MISRHDDEYRGVTRLAEIERCKDDGWLENLPPNKGSKAHIVGLGFRVKLDHRGTALTLQLRIA